ncbi:cation:H+ antiporter [Desulfonatronum thiosulfatophilum]|uniref:Cation:H+ antiporter n=1 Tax=Desulfonatronum thiosulfatophilum TaxID=617002 RepID=A0A1G6E103_9BACT|nr:calcium/sodium antiporter [Desulfonatronum thiosulfatophilum]SDB51139.1 cation:H+ antiporter [Desulfonatronum thiosulfatophilum]
MDILANLLLIAFSAGLLWKGADLIVDNASAIARRLGISELVIGLTIVAAGTSAPEFLVTITAAYQGLAEISLSNILGSNIFNLGLILGLVAMIRPIPTHPTLLYRDGGMLLGLTMIMMSFIALDFLGRWSGMLLLAGLVGYVGYLFSRAPKAIAEATITSSADLKTENPGDPAATWRNYPLLMVGFLGVALGGKFMVQSATELAMIFGVSQWVIGVTIVAGGTSLPELATCLAASLKGRNDMILGNLLGSDIFNFAGVLGLTMLLRPLHAPHGALLSMILLNAMMLLVLFFIRSNWKISRPEGALLICLALFRWGMDIGFS